MSSWNLYKYCGSGGDDDNKDFGGRKYFISLKCEHYLGLVNKHGKQ